jgi:peptidoglycan biosynthesis protein MviN/MurJ (putative lipid II flippase)
MAVGTLVSFAIQAVAMLWILDRRIGGLGMSKSAGPIIKMIVATLVMGLVCLGVEYSPLYPHGSRKVIWAAQLMLIMFAGGLSYFIACAIMGIDVMKHVRPKRGLAA